MASCGIMHGEGVWQLAGVWEEWGMWRERRWKGGR
jgi:hypothetical protein